MVRISGVTVIASHLNCIHAWSRVKTRIHDCTLSHVTASLCSPSAQQPREGSDQLPAQQPHRPVSQEEEPSSWVESAPTRSLHPPRRQSHSIPPLHVHLSTDLRNRFGRRRDENTRGILLDNLRSSSAMNLWEVRSFYFPTR